MCAIALWVFDCVRHSVRRAHAVINSGGNRSVCKELSIWKIDSLNKNQHPYQKLYTYKNGNYNNFAFQCALLNPITVIWSVDIFTLLSSSPEASAPSLFRNNPDIKAGNLAQGSHCSFSFGVHLHERSILRDKNRKSHGNRPNPRLCASRRHSPYFDRHTSTNQLNGDSSHSPVINLFRTERGFPLSYRSAQKIYPLHSTVPVGRTKCRESSNLRKCKGLVLFWKSTPLNEQVNIMFHLFTQQTVLISSSCRYSS